MMEENANLGTITPNQPLEYPSGLPTNTPGATPPESDKPKSKKKLIIIGAAAAVVIAVGAVAAGVMIANNTSDDEVVSEPQSETEIAIQNTGKYEDLLGVYAFSTYHYASSGTYKSKYAESEFVLTLYDFPITADGFNSASGENKRLSGHSSYGDVYIDMGVYDIDDQVYRTSNDKLYEVTPAEIFLDHDAWQEKFGLNSAPPIGSRAFQHTNAYSGLKAEQSGIKTLGGQQFWIWHGVAEAKHPKYRSSFANVYFVSYATIDHDTITWLTVVSRPKADAEGYSHHTEGYTESGRINYPVESATSIKDLEAAAEKVASTYRVVTFATHDEIAAAEAQIAQDNLNKYNKLMTADNH